MSFNSKSRIKYVVLLVMGMMTVLGCTTEYNLATGKQESYMYGDDKEASLGAGIALQIEKQMTFSTEVDVNQRVQKIFDRLVAVCDRRDLVYTIHVVDEDVVNAFSLPGGYIYIYKGLIDKVKNDDQLAAVIAHEIAHVTAKHAMKRLQNAYGAMVLQTGALVSRNYELAAGINLTASSVIFANSRDDEFESDALGIKYLKLAGFKTEGMTEMLKLLEEVQAKEPPRPLNYWRTHPYLPQRISRANKSAQGKTEYRDYLNIVGEDR